MSKVATEIIQIKKIKKDGSLDASLHAVIVARLEDNKTVILPVDYIYGICLLDTAENYHKLVHLNRESGGVICRLVSNFKMLEDFAVIGKLEFDFLHRIWPGEMVVYLNDKKTRDPHLPLRIPKGKSCQDIINSLERPLLFAPLMKATEHPLYQKSAIIGGYTDKVDCILAIDEFCKEHTLPTVLDIRNGELVIVNEGRISADEIKSLYFLGKDDSAL